MSEQERLPPIETVQQWRERIKRERLQVEGSPNLEEMENGFIIRHEWMGRAQEVEAEYPEDEKRLHLCVDGKEVYLTMAETGYFLAWMATWYDRGGD
jgi:hypothetical protein